MSHQAAGCEASSLGQTPWENDVSPDWCAQRSRPGWLRSSRGALLVLPSEEGAPLRENGALHVSHPQAVK